MLRNTVWFVLGSAATIATSVAVVKRWAKADPEFMSEAFEYYKS